MSEEPFNTMSAVAWGVLGALLGVNGAVIGVMFARDFRRYRRFAGANMYVWKYLGLACVGMGAVFLYGGYSLEVWRPCVLGGVVLLFCAAVLGRVIRRRKEEIEESFMHPRHRRH